LIWLSSCSGLFKLQASLLEKMFMPRSNLEFSCEQKPLATLVATEGQTCTAGKIYSNTGDNLWEKLWQTLNKDWARKWETTGKCRKHIAYPHDIVCSRWHAQAASEFAPHANEVTILNQMVVASNDHI
jgi:hypothetical protein